MALKAVIFALHSRSQTYELGIKPDRAVKFLSKVLTVADESENALKTAEELLKLRTHKRVENVEKKIQQLDTKIEKPLLSERRKCELEGEKDALQERLANLKELEKNESSSSQRKTQQRKRKIAQDLIANNRLKKGKLGAGAPQLLDSEDETFIAKAISTKSTCHGRRHETTLFTNHRVKKRDFLHLTNYSLMKRGKRLIKSATTVGNQGKPKNIRSIAAKSHVGKWLWCSKKPPKTEDHDTVSTHHQRAHVLNAKLTMFSENQKEHRLVVSMDDKAYLRPGTDVGARNTKAGVIYNVCDPDEQKQLAQHDFNIPQVKQTPASFRCIKKHIETIQGKHEFNKRPRSKLGNHSSQILHWE
ncbi:RNA-directed DNA polymerase from transposon X-element [Paramuricea clavata]|uniref:RNA-directed DNA polymerase from transposon X-element n=1 Tax=Paramuricea clavata TaxID=317549 RepID=A0A7D9IE34_PARCT|nr:RNA-directed DNA polymerase from transposon X-element [Paramuricea clavata]